MFLNRTACQVHNTLTANLSASDESYVCYFVYILREVKKPLSARNELSNCFIQAQSEFTYVKKHSPMFASEALNLDVPCSLDHTYFVILLGCLG